MINLKKITMLAIIGIMVSGLVGCGKATPEDITKELSNGNYSSAVKDFNQLTEEEKSKMVEEFKQQATKIKDDFIKGTIEKTKAIEALTEIKLVNGMEEVVNGTITIINNIESSKSAFAEAKKAEEANDNIKAIEQYGKVIQEDTANYDIAQSKVDELNKKIEDSIPVKIVGTRLDRNIIDNQILNVQLNNKSDKPTKKITFVVFAYDKNKLPVKLNFGYDYYIGCKLETPLQPGETSRTDWTWDLYPQGNEVAEVVVVLNEVEFFEGEKWTNPSLSASIEKYAEKPLK